MDFGQIVSLIAALGLGTILPQTVKAIIARYTGRADREQNAWRQRDLEARHRRLLEESLHQHRSCWHRETGKPYDDMPDWPPRPGR